MEPAVVTCHRFRHCGSFSSHYYSGRYSGHDPVHYSVPDGRTGRRRCSGGCNHVAVDKAGEIL